jgi:excisionase family DNA binding protein
MENEIFENRLMKPTEVARLLNISRSLAYRLLNSGKIPSLRINKSIRVDPSDLEKFINNQKTRALSRPG